jgi:quercetin dioxygenase-like cupin family protein
MDQLQENRNKEASKRRTTSHKKRVASYAYAPLTLPGEEKHLRAYRVTIDQETEHKGVEYHHEGEEFIYILHGGLTIQVGQNTSTLKKGECISFPISSAIQPGKRQSYWLSYMCRKEGTCLFN